ncbi:PA14 domain-containing protein [Patescibacteria group bacterium]
MNFRSNTGRSGFTLVELLLAVVISASLFVLVSSVLVNLFRSDTKSKQSQTIEQTKNDIKTELTNRVRWADNIAYDISRLEVDGDVYRIIDERFTKNGIPLSHKNIIVSNFQVVKHTPTVDADETESGYGLIGIYYDDIAFSERKFEQIDSQIRHDWGSDSPDPEIDVDSFSIRWTGQLESVTEGDYTFTLESNDGSKLWIDDELVVDNWSGGIATGNKYLLSSKRHNVMVEYFDNSGDASIVLSWTTPGGDLQVIPSTYLYPNALSTSLEISMDLEHRNDSTLMSTLRNILTPRSGTISGGIVDPIPSVTDAPIPTDTPTPTPFVGIPGAEDCTSGWGECNGWKVGSACYRVDYDKHACRSQAMWWATVNWARYADDGNSYENGLGDPPSGVRNDFSATFPDSDEIWYSWGRSLVNAVGIDGTFGYLGIGSSCGMGPSYCMGSVSPTSPPGPR